MLGGALSYLSERLNPYAPRWVALLTTLTSFVLVIIFWLGHYHRFTLSPAPNWLEEFRLEWIPTFGISFHLAIDGLSLILLALTCFLGLLAVLCSWREIQERTGFFYFNLLWILAGVAGVFMAIDLFLFYFFWEIMLIPMYFLIGIWGGHKRVYAAYKFFIFTQASGLLMLLSILGLYYSHGQLTGHYTFNYTELLGTTFSDPRGFWLMMGFCIAFAVKLPLIPFHAWLPDAHSEAPTAGSLLLAGILLKTGAYGLLRFVLPIFPVQAMEIATPAMWLGVTGVLYGAFLAFSQTDLKRLIAYTSVSHMGFVMMGLFAFNELALQGVVMQLITHAISTGALFLLAGMLKERLHTRDIGQMGGLWTRMPQLGTLGLVFALASLGLPGFGNFVAEFLILLGSFEAHRWHTVIAALGLVFSAVYSLRIVQKIFLGPQNRYGVLADFTHRERLMMGILAISIFWLGLFPQPVIHTARPAIVKLVELLSKESDTAYQPYYEPK